jgi:hypothetical protein
MSPTVTIPNPPAAPDLPADPPPPAAPGPLRNGNPRGNPNLAPRCGAKNRAGSPCCAPAMANGRCQMHGGKCTGPRTAQGKAAVKAAHTRHGRTTARQRAANLYTRTLNVRGRLTREARRLSAHLPPDMADRLAKGPVELWPPVHLSNHPYVTNPESAWLSAKSHPVAARSRTAPQRSAAPAPHGLAAERLAARAEKAAMAPWRHAIAAARAAKRAVRAAKREAKREAKAARQQARAARTAARPTRPAPRAPGADCQPRTARPSAPPVPIVPCTGDSPMQRKLATLVAGLRALANRPPQGAPTPGPTAPFAPSRIDPMDREPAAKSAIAPFKQSRIDPMDREPTAKPGSIAPFEQFRIDPMDREPAPKPAPTAPFKQFRIDPMDREPPAAPPPTSPTPTNGQSPKVPPAPLNRAERRRLKYLQRRRDRAAGPRP